MRIRRVEKFKKVRHEKRRKLFVFAFLLPSMSIFLGYIITSLLILPSMSR